MKAYGDIRRWTERGQFVLKLLPHVRGKIRRFFPWAKMEQGALIIPDTPANCEDLEMMLGRWHLVSPDGTDGYIRQRAAEARDRMFQCEEILKRKSVGKLPTIVPLRDYQILAVDLLMHRNRLLVGDDVGLGKTAVAIGAIASGATPAIIVCQNHLTVQWEKEIRKFIGNGIRIFTVRTGNPQRVPGHEVLIIPYSLLAKWADRLHGYALICFDEAQELRRHDSKKYEAAQLIASGCERTLGLTATPVYNYGDEMFNVCDLLEKDCLGPRHEFIAEWCMPIGGKHRVVDPQALGFHLAEQHVFLRRRRAEVGRELPPVTRIIHDVEYDQNALARFSKEALQLAKAILSSESTFTEKGQSARRLDLLLRQKTGIAKAPSVAEFVAEMVASGEHVTLFGWHREVYETWCRVFQDREVPFALYTGSESTSEKDAAAKSFLSGPPGVLIMSLRSGAGLNGLQEKCSVVVFGELDWSPQVHHQCIGRLRRDGQTKNVTVIFLVASGGSDPVVSRLLGLKREQSDGIVDPGQEKSDLFDAQAETSRGTELARQILEASKSEIKS